MTIEDADETFMRTAIAEARHAEALGDVPVGGDAPITVQTMTNTLTTDARATIRQVQAAGGRAYRFPLDVVAIDGDGNRVLVETLAVSKVNQSFEFKAGERPTEIEWDPNTRLLFERANTESGK